MQRSFRKRCPINKNTEDKNTQEMPSYNCQSFYEPTTYSTRAWTGVQTKQLQVEGLKTKKIQFTIPTNDRILMRVTNGNILYKKMNTPSILACPDEVHIGKCVMVRKKAQTLCIKPGF
jgi:hypothetical protein